MPTHADAKLLAKMIADIELKVAEAKEFADNAGLTFDYFYSDNTWYESME